MIKFKELANLRSIECYVNTTIQSIYASGVKYIINAFKKESYLEKYILSGYVHSGQNDVMGLIPTSK